MVLAPLKAAFRSIDQANTGTIQSRPQLASIFLEGRLNQSHFRCIPTHRPGGPTPGSRVDQGLILSRVPRELQRDTANERVEVAGSDGGESFRYIEDFLRRLLAKADVFDAGASSFSCVASALLNMSMSS